jgi:hypothetical protein
MRLTAFLLAMLVLLLSCLPCADIEAMPAPVKAGTELAGHQSPQQDRHDDSDLCSPFCHCSCCASYSVINLPVQLPVLLLPPECRSYNTHLSEDVIEISLPVWQPPQLV